MVGNNAGGPRVPQETFVNCADVAITVEGGSQPKPIKQVSALKRRSGGVTKYDEMVSYELPYICEYTVVLSRLYM